ncbi:UNVERIFIED_CONTAM: hypothetical protein Q9R58_22250 [Methylobacteriaceae bacterium AG10]|nr:hypothetical protein [Methylobacteriaceae bacterium AG10]
MRVGSDTPHLLRSFEFTAGCGAGFKLARVRGQDVGGALIDAGATLVQVSGLGVARAPQIGGQRGVAASPLSVKPSEVFALR